jgi:hypothetical protein
MDDEIKTIENNEIEEMTGLPKRAQDNWCEIDIQEENDSTRHN